MGLTNRHLELTIVPLVTKLIFSTFRINRIHYRRNLLHSTPRMRKLL